MRERGCDAVHVFATHEKANVSDILNDCCCGKIVRLAVLIHRRQKIEEIRYEIRYDLRESPGFNFNLCQFALLLPHVCGVLTCKFRSVNVTFCTLSYVERPEAVSRISDPLRARLLSKYHGVEEARLKEGKRVFATWPETL